MQQALEQFSVWLSEKRNLPYGLRKSIVKRLHPGLLKNHPFTMDFFGLSYEGNAGDAINRMVYFCGAYEKYMLFFLRDLVAHWKEAKAHAPLVFWDVGANVGNHALFMSQRVDRVEAFEPYAPVRAQLEGAMKRNNITNIHLHPFGLGNQDKTLPFYAPTNANLGTGSFSKQHSNTNDYIGELEIAVADDLVQQKKLPLPTLVKLDIEGFERHALEGMRSTLRKARPLVLLELSHTTRSSFKDAHDFAGMFPSHYSFLRFSRASRDKGVYRIAPLVYDRAYKHQEVIACPVEMLADVAKVTGDREILHRK